MMKATTKATPHKFSPSTAICKWKPTKAKKNHKHKETRKSKKPEYRKGAQPVKSRPVFHAMRVKLMKIKVVSPADSNTLARVYIADDRPIVMDMDRVIATSATWFHGAFLNKSRHHRCRNTTPRYRPAPKYWSHWHCTAQSGPIAAIGAAKTKVAKSWQQTIPYTLRTNSMRISWEMALVKRGTLQLLGTSSPCVAMALHLL
mmetsp:Transcript_20563/g.47152  ORF Transcript_20563/g.47152 Transcript_20563/m.47152 type:complete len:202 (-) Transcript_20563:57-662(-)